MRDFKTIVWLVFVSIASTSIVYQIQGSLEQGYFYLPAGVGTGVNGSEPSLSFNLLLDVSSSATMIPDKICSGCTDGSRYDKESSLSADPIECTDSFCKEVEIESLCPAHHSDSHQCCDTHSFGLCWWDNSLQYNTIYEASGAIVKDKLKIGDYQVSSHIVDVFDASWASLPSSVDGIIGLGEESCNPTCLHPFYHSILEKEIDDYNEEKMQLSVCFGNSKGLLTLGETAETLRKSDPVKAHQRAHEVGYTFDLQDLRLNNESYTGLTALGLNRVVLLETVFSEIRLPQDLFDSYEEEMKASYSSLPGVSDGSVFKGQSISSIDGFPTFDVQLPGVLLHLPPSLYFLRTDASGSASWKLQIIPNQFQNTVQLGLSALRGFVTEFQFESVYFASVNPSLCADGEGDAVGSAEWAPERAKSGVLNPVTVISVVACVAMVGLMLFLCRSQAKERKELPVQNVEMANMPKEEYVPTKNDPFRDTHEPLI